MIARHVLEDSTRYVVNEAFNRAVVYFKDGSDLTFEHTSRENRWVKASLAGSIADGICLSLRQFRLNAKHLQLFFEDDSDVEFFANATSWKRWNGTKGNDDAQKQS